MTAKTARPAPLVLGIQPGGRGRFGVAARQRSGGSESDVVKSVDEAVAWFRACVGEGDAPDAAGIAAPLFWETGAGGARRGDAWLRRARPELARSIRPLNATMGATVVQGMAIALRLRALWPAIALNETRPGQLLGVFRSEPGYPGSALARLASSWEALNEAAGDRLAALFSAWWTARCLEGPEPHDLALLSPKAVMPAGQATSFWPIEPARWLAA